MSVTETRGKKTTKLFLNITLLISKYKKSQIFTSVFTNLIRHHTLFSKVGPLWSSRISNNHLYFSAVQFQKCICLLFLINTVTTNTKFILNTANDNNNPCRHNLIHKAKAWHSMVWLSPWQREGCQTQNHVQSGLQTTVKRHQAQKKTKKNNANQDMERATAAAIITDLQFLRSNRENKRTDPLPVRVTTNATAHRTYIKSINIILNRFLN